MTKQSSERALAICLLLISSFNYVKGQDIHFAQFWMTPLILNPAQAGAESDMRAIINYRNQWNSVASPYSTGNFSLDFKITKNPKKGFSSIGLNTFYDKAGDAKMTTFNGNVVYAYHIMLNKRNSLGAGFSVGYEERSMSSEELKWMNQYDGSTFNTSLPSGEQNTVAKIANFDPGAGLHYQYRKDQKYITGNNHVDINAGIGTSHLNRPKYSFYQTEGENLKIKTISYLNAHIGLSNSDVSLAPGITYFRQGKASELLMGAMVYYQLKEESKYTGYVKGAAISFGGFYRNKDAIIAAMLLEVSQYAIGMSYDFNISKLREASNGKGGFEISIRYINPNPFLYQQKPRI